MKAAARLAGRVTKLVLLEANPFYLLAICSRKPGALMRSLQQWKCATVSKNLARWANGT